MNKDKVGGEPFYYPNTFLLLLLGYAKAHFHLPYRQTKDGIAQGHAKWKVPSIPDYTTINRRINRLDIKIKDTDNKSNKEFKDEYIVIAIDSTGIKVMNNRGQWMKEKWNVWTKGYLKIHVAVNVKTKKKILLSMKEVTDEHVHDSSKELHELVDNIIKSDSMTTTTTIDKLFADGAYEGNEIFRYLWEIMESCLIVSK